MPGMLSRSELADRMRETKTFLHFGSGQGDRSVIEAGACGCKIVIAQPRYHNPAVLQAAAIVDAEKFTIEWIESLSPVAPLSAVYFRETFGADRVAQSHRPLYEFIANNKPGNIEGFLNG